MIQAEVEGNVVKNNGAGGAQEVTKTAIEEMDSNIRRYFERFDAIVRINTTLDELLSSLSEKSNIKKEYLMYGLGLVLAFLAVGRGGELLCTIVGFVYPAYCSINALESQNKNDDTQWLMYWVVFAVISVIGFFSDILIGWVPFYWLLKSAFIFWCMSPLNGAPIIYTSVILPWFKTSKTIVTNTLKRRKKIRQVREKLASIDDQSISPGVMDGSLEEVWKALADIEDKADN